MNKRQRKKRLKQIRQHFEGHCRKALSRFVGQPCDAEALDRISDTVSGSIRGQLASSLSVMTFLLSPMNYTPPYKKWADERNVVHWTGLTYDVNGKQIGTRFCDFQFINDDRMVMMDEPVTCVPCCAVEDERKNPCIS